MICDSVESYRAGIDSGIDSGSCKDHLIRTAPALPGNGLSLCGVGY